MQAEAANVAWRMRTRWEGSDLGVRLLQSAWQPVFRCYIAVAVPTFLLFGAGFAFATWLPVLLIWLSKPWLDRTILFALSRALFGETTNPTDVWRSRRPVWWSQWLSALTLRRLSASRSFTQPIMQLEGLRGSALRARVSLVAGRHRGTARYLTQCFSVAESALTVSLIALEFWLAPHHDAVSWSEMASGGGPVSAVRLYVYYAMVVAFLEPFYVAAGFGMYLNRRVELEAWDIEQEFRRAFAN